MLRAPLRFVRFASPLCPYCTRFSFSFSTSTIFFRRARLETIPASCPTTCPPLLLSYYFIFSVRFKTSRDTNDDRRCFLRRRTSHHVVATRRIDLPDASRLAVATEFPSKVFFRVVVVVVPPSTSFGLHAIVSRSLFVFRARSRPPLTRSPFRPLPLSLLFLRFARLPQLPLLPYPSS